MDEFSELPEEMKVLVLSFLNYSDLRATASLNRSFYPCSTYAIYQRSKRFIESSKNFNNELSNEKLLEQGIGASMVSFSSLNQTLNADDGSVYYDFKTVDRSRVVEPLIQIPLFDKTIPFPLSVDHSWSICLQPNGKITVHLTEDLLKGMTTPREQFQLKKNENNELILDLKPTTALKPSSRSTP